jgi:hypothetical protein
MESRLRPDHARPEVSRTSNAPGDAPSLLPGTTPWSSEAVLSLSTRRRCSDLSRRWAFVLAVLVPAPTLAAQAPCSAAENRQFDFWVGDWDSYDIDKEAVPSARVHVDSILDGCALLEVYEGTNGVHGESFSIYDASRKVWHQTWVTNRGKLLTIEGRFETDRMVLAGATLGPEGQPATIRGTWKAEAGRVREWAETSTDSGKTWTKLFDLVFRPHPR